MRLINYGVQACIVMFLLLVGMPIDDTVLAVMFVVGLIALNISSQIQQLLSDKGLLDV